MAKKTFYRVATEEVLSDFQLLLTRATTAFASSKESKATIIGLHKALASAGVHVGADVPSLESMRPAEDGRITLSRLRILAQAVYKKIEKFAIAQGAHPSDDGYLSGLCADASFIMQKVAEANGIDLTLVSGEYGSDEEGHMWCKYGYDIVVDVTATQFTGTHQPYIGPITSEYTVWKEGRDALAMWQILRNMPDDEVDSYIDELSTQQAPANLDTELDKALEPYRNNLKTIFNDTLRSSFKKMVDELGPSLKGVYNSNKWAKVFKEIRYGLTNTMEVKYGMRTGPDNWVVDDKKAEALAKSYANTTIDALRVKMKSKIGQMTNVSIASLGNKTFRINGTRDGHKIEVEQTLIVTSRGYTVFNQYPARIYVDGKFTPEAVYKSMFSEA